MGTSPSFNAIKIGDTPPPLVCGPLTRTQFVRYAGASHDFNPNHHDEVYAQANGNKTVFGMGMLPGGYCARAPSITWRSPSDWRCSSAWWWPRWPPAAARNRRRLLY